MILRVHRFAFHLEKLTSSLSNAKKSLHKVEEIILPVKWGYGYVHKAGLCIGDGKDCFYKNNSFLLQDLQGLHFGLKQEGCCKTDFSSSWPSQGLGGNASFVWH